MLDPRCSPEHPVAILSFHSHSDRSFLDDRELALLSGALREDGIANDLVLVVITRELEASLGDSDAERRLVETLSAYDPIVYERVWSPELVERLRRKLHGKVFVGLRGEHLLLDTPADIFCDGNPKQLLGPLVQWLRGQAAAPPSETLFRQADNGTPGWAKRDDGVAAPQRAFAMRRTCAPL